MNSLPLKPVITYQIHETIVNNLNWLASFLLLRASTKLRMERDGHCLEAIFATIVSKSGLVVSNNCNNNFITDGNFAPALTDKLLDYDMSVLLIVGRKSRSAVTLSLLP